MGPDRFCRASRGGRGSGACALCYGRFRGLPPHRPTAPLPQAVVDSGALDALVGCLEEFDPGVKEAAAWALGELESGAIRAEALP